jgi:hypothetical protein
VKRLLRLLFPKILLYGIGATGLESWQPWRLGPLLQRSHTIIAYNSCLMGRFRNGELATWLDGPSDGVSRVSTLIGLPFALHYNVTTEIAAFARSRFGRHRVFRTSISRFDAQHHGNAWLRIPKH